MSLKSLGEKKTALPHYTLNIDNMINVTQKNKELETTKIPEELGCGPGGEKKAMGRSLEDKSCADRTRHVHRRHDRGTQFCVTPAPCFRCCGKYSNITLKMCNLICLNLNHNSK